VPWFSEGLLSEGAPSPVADSGQMVAFYQGILQLRSEVLLASWSGPPHIDDPRIGSVDGVADFVDYVKCIREWLVVSDAVVHAVATLSSAERSIEEVRLDLDVAGERRDLPVAVAAEWGADHHLSSIRVYHSLWPFFPGQHVHYPSIARSPDVLLPAPVRENIRADTAGDLEAFLNTYEDDAVVHTFSGKMVAYGGRGEIRRLYTGHKVQGVRPEMKICAVTSGDHSCAVEYQVSHAVDSFLDHAGLKVYEFDSNKIHTERIYADLVPCDSELAADASFG
jgi:hypothetical protein